MMLENERLIKEFAKAEANARAVFMTGSGMSGGTLRQAQTARYFLQIRLPDCAVPGLTALFSRLGGTLS